MAVFLAIIALVIWCTLATSIVTLSSISPMLITGLGLLAGGVLGLPWVKWRSFDKSALLIGAGAMLGYHAIYFISLKMADPVVASLLHYLWPLFIIFLTPVFLKGSAITARSLLAGVIGFLGAAICIGSSVGEHVNSWAGYLLALVSALIWAGYSVWSKKMADVPVSAVSVYCLVAGFGSIVLSFAFDGWPVFWLQVNKITNIQWLIIFYLGLGPLGGAFYLWDYAMKTGSPQKIALIAYAVPVVSTIFMQLTLGRELTLPLMLGAVFVTFAVAVGSSAKSELKRD